jgi:hypothetical protein
MRADCNNGMVACAMEPGPQVRLVSSSSLLIADKEQQGYTGRAGNPRRDSVPATSEMHNCRDLGESEALYTNGAQVEATSSFLWR